MCPAVPPRSQFKVACVDVSVASRRCIEAPTGRRGGARGVEDVGVVKSAVWVVGGWAECFALPRRGGRNGGWSDVMCGGHSHQRGIGSGGERGV
eukprot:7700249-Alexandrium_andersonii.AAC.1